jgi:ATP-binding cassette, subfamily C (CFTR/MRP), member 1
MAEEGAEKDCREFTSSCQTGLSPETVVKVMLTIYQGLITVYTGLQLVVLTYWTVGPLPTSQFQIAAAALVFVNGLLLALLSYVEHTRSVRPSTIINVYLLFTSLFDCAIARTLWLLDGAHAVARLFTAATSAKALILISEAWEKRSILRVQYRDLSPETTSGILGRSVFWWINPLMKLGFSNFLTEHDLYVVLSVTILNQLMRYQVCR